MNSCRTYGASRSRTLKPRTSRQHCSPSYFSALDCTTLLNVRLALHVITIHASSLLCFVTIILCWSRPLPTNIRHTEFISHGCRVVPTRLTVVQYPDKVALNDGFLFLSLHFSSTLPGSPSRCSRHLRLEQRIVQHGNKGQHHHITHILGHCKPHRATPIQASALTFARQLFDSQSFPS